MSSRLNGKTALVTGASRGIGRAAALALAKAGADVAVNFFTREADAQEVCSEIKADGRRALAIKADVSKASEVSRLVETVESKLGTIGILVNNRGLNIAVTESLQVNPNPLPCYETRWPTVSKRLAMVKCESLVVGQSHGDRLGLFCGR